MGNATVASVSATPAGRARTVTAPRAQTPACPPSACCAAHAAAASVACATARSPAPTDRPARNAPPAPMPAR